MSIGVSIHRFFGALRPSLPAIAPPRPLLTVCLMGITLLSNAYAAGSASRPDASNVEAEKQTTATVPHFTTGQTFAVHPEVPPPVPLRVVPPLDDVVALSSLDTRQDQEHTEIQTLDALYKAVGTVRAAGRVRAQKDPQPAGTLPLKSYRLEEIPLEQSLHAMVQGKETMVQKAWRLTITGGPFPVRAMPAMLWIGNAMVGYGRETADLSAIAAVTFDETIIAEGATIAISYDVHGQRTLFPEPLTFGQSHR